MHRADEARTIERQRRDRARRRKSNSPGLPAARGRSPRPSTRIRSPTRRVGGSPSTITEASPDAARHRLPMRTRSILTTHSLAGPIAARRAGSSSAAGSRRNDSSTTPVTAMGAGVPVSRQARSSSRKRSNVTADQAAAAQMMARPRAPAARRGFPAERAAPQPMSEPKAPHHHASPPPANASGTHRPTTHPAARHAAATTRGRLGNGSRRRRASSRPLVRRQSSLTVPARPSIASSARRHPAATHQTV